MRRLGTIAAFLTLVILQSRWPAEGESPVTIDPVDVWAELAGGPLADENLLVSSPQVLPLDLQLSQLVDVDVAAGSLTLDPLSLRFSSFRDSATAVSTGPIAVDWQVSEDGEAGLDTLVNKLEFWGDALSGGTEWIILGDAPGLTVIPLEIGFDGPFSPGQHHGTDPAGGLVPEIANQPRATNVR